MTDRRALLHRHRMKQLVVVVSLVLVGACNSGSDALPDARTPDASVGRPSLVVDPVLFDFGKVATGTTSPPATFTLHNASKAPSGPVQFHVGNYFAVDAG